MLPQHISFIGLLLLNIIVSIIYIIELVGAYNTYTETSPEVNYGLFKKLFIV